MSWKFIKSYEPCDHNLLAFYISGGGDIINLLSVSDTSCSFIEDGKTFTCPLQYAECKSKRSGSRRRFEIISQMLKFIFTETKILRLQSLRQNVKEIVRRVDEKLEDDRTENFNQLLKQAYRLKFEQNKDARNCLMLTIGYDLKRPCGYWPGKVLMELQHEFVKNDRICKF